jgi:hypothetical protein
VDRDNLGHFDTTSNHIVQTLKSVMGGIWGVPAYWNHLIYFQGSGDVLKAFGITNAVITSQPVTKAPSSFSTFTTPSISASGNNNGIAWVIQTDAYNNANGVTGGPGVLHAYNATNLTQELYNSSQNLTRDNPGAALKYAAPVVANGKVYVRGEYALSVFGLAAFLPAPVISPAGGLFTNSVTVTITNSIPGASIYYTLDGTIPTTNATSYTGPFVLTNTTLVQAIAAQAGAVNSAVVSASFVNSPPTGNGTTLRITSVGLIGPTLTLKAVNGSTNGIYYLLTSPDLNTPLSQWTRVLTNQFDANGNLSLSTNIINPADTQRFYILQMQ